MMGRYPHFSFNPVKKDIAICDEVIERMNLVGFKQRNYLTLSGGEKQRVHFARVLVQIWEKKPGNYRYLFLDEPLASLDINYQHEFLQIARQFAQADTVLVAIIHDINLAVQYADKLFFLKDGELFANGSPSTVLSKDLIKQILGIETTIITNPVSGAALVICN